VENFPVEHSLDVEPRPRPRFPLTLISLTGLLQDSFSELPRSLAAVVTTYVSQMGAVLKHSILCILGKRSYTGSYCGHKVVFSTQHTVKLDARA
jgi:hypothetical protein